LAEVKVVGVVHVMRSQVDPAVEEVVIVAVNKVN
jgi:hypothetical protein